MTSFNKISLLKSNWNNTALEDYGTIQVVKVDFICVKMHISSWYVDMCFRDAQNSQTPPQLLRGHKPKYLD